MVNRRGPRDLRPCTRLLARREQPEVHEDGRLDHLRVVPDLLGREAPGQGTPLRGRFVGVCVVGRHRSFSSCSGLPSGVLWAILLHRLGYLSSR